VDKEETSAKVPKEEKQAKRKEQTNEMEVITETILKPIEEVVDRNDIVDYDAPLPEHLPVPSEALVTKGQFYFKPPTEGTLKDYCYMYKQNWRSLLQPPSTYVSVTAKGVDIGQYIDLQSPVPGVSGFEPVCPAVERSPQVAFEHLPAYEYRDRLGFYKPEKALRDALQTLGHEKERIEHVAARLYFAMRASQSEGHDGGVHWTLSTAAALYWRVKGDAQNAIKCLRHSLNNSPPEMREVAMVSLANIFHQAGFLHSALTVAGKALEVSNDPVVAVHFTLANIYASIGDFPKALRFYYATVARQSNFQPAKDRIRAIYCELDGKVSV
jgi:tetratricopeptide (TPR) repeat protein